MKLYLARHGQSVGNVKKLFYGWTDLPLTEQGREDARLLGEKLRGVPLAACYASPLSRAAETARIGMAGRDVPVVLLEGLKEQGMGELEDTTLEENLEKYPELIEAMLRDWTLVVPPGGESCPVLRQRVLAALDEILRAGEDALIVAHNGTLTAILTHLLEIPLGAIDRFWLLHGFYTCISLEEGRVRLECFNR